MKKIIALVVAVLMLAAIAVPAFAEEETPVTTNQINQGAQTGTSEVTFGVDESYIINIPKTIAFGTALSTTATIAASGVTIAGDKVLKVTVKSDNYKPAEGETPATWQLIDTATHEVENVQVPNSDNVAYMIKYNSADVVSNETVILTVASKAVFDGAGNPIGNSGSSTLNFSTKGTSQVGTYKDTLTFTAAVVAAA